MIIEIVASFKLVLVKVFLSLEEVVKGFFKKRKVGKIFGNAEQCKKSGKLTQSLNYYKECVQLCEKNNCNDYYKAKSLFEIGDIYYYTKNNNDEALNYFTKVIEEFKNRFSDKKIRVCVAKAYNRRGIVEHAIAKKDSSGRIDLRKSKENYDQVIDTFFEYDDPDVVLEVARARLNLEALCKRTNYNELYQMEFNCQKFFLQRSSLNNYNDELLKLKALAYWNARQWPDVLKTLDCVKGKDTENTEIDTKIWQLNNFRFWEGRPISLYEVFVNTVMREGDAYQDKDKVFESLHKIKNCVEHQKYGKIKKSLSDELVNNVCKKIIDKFIHAKALELSQVRNCREKVAICNSIINTLKQLEEKCLLSEEQSDHGKKQVYNITLKFLYSNYGNIGKSREDIISLCNNLLEKLPLPKSKYYWGIIALTVPIYDRLGQDNVVIEKCKELDGYSENLPFSFKEGFGIEFHHGEENFYILFFIFKAFLSRWHICKREAVIKSNGWKVMVEAGDVITKVNRYDSVIEAFQILQERKKDVEIIKEIVDKEKENESSVIREKVFDYFYKKITRSTTDDDYREFIRTFGKVVDDSKIKEGVDKVILQYAEFICGSSSSLEKQDKRDMLDELKKWCEFPNYQQYIDRLNNN